MRDGPHIITIFLNDFVRFKMRFCLIQAIFKKGHNNVLNLDRILIIYRLSAGENHVQIGGLQFTDKKIFPP